MGKAGEPQSTSQSGTNDPLTSPPQIISEPTECEGDRRLGMLFVVLITNHRILLGKRLEARNMYPLPNPLIRHVSMLFWVASTASARIKTIA